MASSLTVAFVDMVPDEAIHGKNLRAVAAVLSPLRADLTLAGVDANSGHYNGGGEDAECFEIHVGGSLRYPFWG